MFLSKIQFCNFFANRNRNNPTKIHEHFNSINSPKCHPVGSNLQPLIHIKMIISVIVGSVDHCLTYLLNVPENVLWGPIHRTLFEWNTSFVKCLFTVQSVYIVLNQVTTPVIYFIFRSSGSFSTATRVENIELVRIIYATIVECIL